MNSVFLSGRLEAPIQVMSSEGAPLHIKAAIRVPHFTAAGIRKSDVFTLSAWRGIAKRFMDQARVGSSIILQGYLSTQSHPESPTMEITVTEFRIVNKENRVKEVPQSEPAIISDVETSEAEGVEQTLDLKTEGFTLTIGGRCPMMTPQQLTLSTLWMWRT